MRHAPAEESVYLIHKSTKNISPCLFRDHIQRKVGFS